MVEGGEEVKGANEGNPNSKDHDNLQLLNEKGASRKGKSCKGCLYYSSTLKSNSRNPGITRSLPKESMSIWNSMTYGFEIKASKYVASMEEKIYTSLYNQMLCHWAAANCEAYKLF